MRVLLMLLLVAACVNTPTPTKEEEPIIEPVQEPKPEPVHPVKKKQEKSVTVIIQKADPLPVCVPLAVDERKRIIQALDCLIESDKKAEKP